MARRTAATDGASEHAPGRPGRAVAVAELPSVADQPVSTDSVVSKVRAIIETLSTEEFGLGLSSLARQSNLSKATVHRLCAELVEWGMVERSGRAFRLGPRLFELGNRVSRRRVLRDNALPYMEDLFVAFRRTVHFAVLDGTEALYVEKLTGHHDVSTPSRVGARMPLHCTAVGKAMLAFSPAQLLAQTIACGLERQTAFTIVSPTVLAQELVEIRRTGLACDREEAKLGLSCIAVPVFGRRGALVGSMSISAQTAAFTPTEFGTALKAKARALGERLDRLGHPEP